MNKKQLNSVDGSHEETCCIEIFYLFAKFAQL